MDDKNKSTEFHPRGSVPANSPEVPGATGMMVGYIKPEVKHESPPTDAEGIYLLFAGLFHDAAGGVGDYLGAFNTIQEAMDALPGNIEWAHIVVFRDKLFHVVMHYDEWYRDEDNIPTAGWRRGAIEP